MEFMCCLKKATLEQSNVGKEQKLKKFKPQVHKMGIVWTSKISSFAITLDFCNFFLRWSLTPT
jgi:hypothetical protein